MQFCTTLTMFEYKQKPTLRRHCTLTTKSDGSFIIWHIQIKEVFPSSGKVLRRSCVYICLCCGTVHPASPGLDCQVTLEKKKGKQPRRPASFRIHVPVCVLRITMGQKSCLRRLLLEHNGRTLREEHISLGKYPSCTKNKMRDSP